MARSPDGRSLAYLAGRPLSRDVSYAVSIVDLATGKVEVLADAGACICLSSPGPAVAWSPDGRLVGFAGTGAKSGFFAVPAHGGEVERLSTRPGGGSLAWQPRIGG